MFPPKQWEEDGHRYIQYVSPEPATREKSRDLFKALDQKLKERRAKEKVYVQLDRNYIRNVLMKS